MILRIKEIIQLYFEDFMLFFFPQVHLQIDWNKGFEFLDQELQQVVRSGRTWERNLNLVHSD
ncbi:MAG: hypothetical protein AAF063_21470 [Cyanobacteria bacterium J06643_5]